MDLPDDVKWQIFSMNASDHGTPKADRLRTTRIASQVCRNWRELIMGSSYIWGRLILIDGQQKKAWMKEVIRRAGESKLWVEVEITSSPTVELPRHLFSTFIGILQKHWDRLEVLEININRDFITAIFYDKIWMHTNRPSPMLRSFAVHGTESTPFPQYLFSEHAPQLHSFSSTTFGIPGPFPWLSTIRSLRFFPHSITNLLEILSTTPLLESLQVDEGSNILDPEADTLVISTIPPISLPRLTTIVATVTYNMFIALFNALDVPAASCGIQLLVNIPGSFLGVERVKTEFTEALALLMMKVPRPSDDQRRLYLEIQPSTVNVNFLPVLSLQFQWGIGGPLRGAVSAVVNSFLPYVHGTTHLDARIAAGGSHYAYTDLAPLLLSMQEVTSIQGDASSLNAFSRIDVEESSKASNYSGPRVLFPVLEDGQPLGTAFGPSGYSGPLLRFLERRKKIGHPISRVCLRITAEEVTKIIESLDKISDLNVKWTDDATGDNFNYVCGSGGFPMTEKADCRYAEILFVLP
ncbi:hypothetical protein D9613_008246 [Agrocybe pediades]|uniref:F-box domain-containing protein n=1 Tax=Agrocybe pediades TaxID=84607 RepID=A0A8H4QT65_9AGAR|nr:hypothetical protein D9613_008246 [Agrocybe pediades]